MINYDEETVRSFRALKLLLKKDSTSTSKLVKALRIQQAFVTNDKNCAVWERPKVKVW